MPVPGILLHQIHVPTGFRVKFQAQIFNDGYRQIFVQIVLNGQFVIDCHTDGLLHAEYISIASLGDQIFHVQSGYKVPPFGQNSFHGDYSIIKASPSKCELDIHLAGGISQLRLSNLIIEFFK